MKIFIDPGHRNNGLDHGATGNGQKESTLALAISNKLKAQLEKHSIVVYMSRKTEDDVISLTQRTTKANNLNADLYLSVHINSASNADATGIEVLYCDNDMLAKNICDSMCQVTGARNRGAKKRTDLHVLNATKAKAVLIECGFISNATECNKLTTDYYQNRLVEAMVEVLVKEYKITVDTDYEKAVQKLVMANIIGSPAAWQKVNLKNVSALLNKLGGVQKLYEKKIISSKELWEHGEYNENHVIALIKKVASTL